MSVEASTLRVSVREAATEKETGVTDADDVVAALRDVKVPRNMSNSRLFMDYVIAQASAPPSNDGFQQLAELIPMMTGTLVEVINALGVIEEAMERGG